MVVKKETINVKVDALVKKQAEDILEQLGIRPEKAIGLLYKQIILHKGLPFELKLPDKMELECPDEEEIAESAEFEKGFKQFCSDPIRMESDLQSIWYYNNVHVECTANLQLELQVSDQKRVRKTIEKKLKKNPFLTFDEIKRHFEEIFFEKIKYDFDEYCNCDDYYAPMAEDYIDNVESVVQDLCKDYGFKLEDLQYEGDTSDYIANR